MNFVRGKRIGNRGELQICQFFNANGIWCDIIEGRNPYYDLVCLMNDYPFFVEVKNDQMANLTKNIAIELKNSRTGKDSGLLVTRANIWVHIIGQKYYAIGVSALKDLIQNSSPLKICDGGDNNAFLYIYDKSMLENFRRLDQLNKKEIYQAVYEMLGLTPCSKRAIL